MPTGGKEGGVFLWLERVTQNEAYEVNHFARDSGVLPVEVPALKGRKKKSLYIYTDLGEAKETVGRTFVANGACVMMCSSHFVFLSSSSEMLFVLPQL